MNAQENEELRHATLEFLAARHPAAYAAAAVQRRVSLEIGAKVEARDVEGALAFLEGKGYARHVTDGLGATKHWLATPEGILAVERGEF